MEESTAVEEASEGAAADAAEGDESQSGCEAGTTPTQAKDINGNNVIICITFNVHVVENEDGHHL